MGLSRPASPLVTALLFALASTAAVADRKHTITQDDFSKPGKPVYTIVDDAQKWSNPCGLLQVAEPGGDTRSFKGDKFSISAVPFTVGADLGVYDHLKDKAVGNQAFEVPVHGSITMASTLRAETPGTRPGRVIEGTYLQSGLPYAKPTFEGQPAGAVLNMIDFATGQLFDWFVSGTRAFTLIERLRSNVTGNGSVGLDKAYTQISAAGGRAGIIPA